MRKNILEVLDIIYKEVDFLESCIDEAKNSNRDLDAIDLEIEGYEAQISYLNRYSKTIPAFGIPHALYIAKKERILFSTDIDDSNSELLKIMYTMFNRTTGKEKMLNRHISATIDSLNAIIRILEND